MKCDICKQDISQIFLKKIVGTIIKDESGKEKRICANCQRKFSNDKKEMLKQL